MSAGGSMGLFSGESSSCFSAFQAADYRYNVSAMKSTLTIGTGRVTQCQKPTGWLGRLVLRNMNSRHSKVTDWGLSQVSVRSQDIVLDVGCGGGKTVSKLATLAKEGKVYGLDYSKESVAVATKLNRLSIDAKRVEIVEGSVSQLPFPDRMFDVVTAVETHFWWPDLPAGMRELFRVVKFGGTVAVIAEVYKGAQTKTAKLVERYLPATGMKFLTVAEHRKVLESAGFCEVRVSDEPSKGWICCSARKI
jgi:SAM-dependent methyltransferase